MGTEIIVAATAIVSAVLGFLASYILQARQRRWALDDQKREWRRSQIKVFSESIEAFTVEIFKNWNLNAEETNTSDLLPTENSKVLENLVASLLIKFDTSFDKELTDRYKVLMDTIVKTFDADRRETGNLFIEFRNAFISLRSRINELTAETYH